MPEHIYKVVELVGSSETSIDDAIRVAVARAGETLRHLRWFEVVDTRGHIEDGHIRHFQVTLKVGLRWTEAATDCSPPKCAKPPCGGFGLSLW